MNFKCVFIMMYRSSNRNIRENKRYFCVSNDKMNISLAHVHILDESPRGIIFGGVYNGKAGSRWEPLLEKRTLGALYLWSPRCGSRLPPATRAITILRLVHTWFALVILASSNMCHVISRSYLNHASNCHLRCENW